MDQISSHFCKMEHKLPTKYIVEIFPPDDVNNHIARFESSHPFSPFVKGELIKASSLETDGVKGLVLGVVNVEHTLFANKHFIVDMVSVYTEGFADKTTNRPIPIS